jgi:hypothetical protein
MPATAPKTPAPVIKWPENMLPDGIYLGLDEDTYHNDPALGSSDIRSLLKGANRYWQRSWMNPKRPAEKLTPSKIFGKAMHKLLLEGREPFRCIYVRRPDDSDDASPSEKSKLTKAMNDKLLEGQFLLKAPEFDFIEDVKLIIDADPELNGCLDNALTEVSVFWTRKDGTRLKCRFDALKLRGYGDLKSIANERDREMGEACRQQIVTYRYDMQIEHYNEGRYMLPKLYDLGHVFVGTTHFTHASVAKNTAVKNAHKFLGEIAHYVPENADEPAFAAQFVFVPKLGNDNVATQAPDAWSTTISPENPILKISRDDIETALMMHRDALKKYGTQLRWLPGRVVSELDISELPWGLSKRAA